MRYTYILLLTLTFVDVGLLTPLIPLKVMVFMVTMKESQIAIIMEITVYIIKIILIKNILNMDLIIK